MQITIVPHCSVVSGFTREGQLAGCEQVDLIFVDCPYSCFKPFTMTVFSNLASVD